jgi:hypothetical protein
MDEDGDYCVVVSAENGVKADDANSVFLIDHAWTYTPDRGFSPPAIILHLDWSARPLIFRAVFIHSHANGNGLSHS